MKVVRAMSIACVLLLVGACASTATKMLAPHLTLVNAAMTSADVFSQQFRVRVHVSNPNDRALPIKSIDYKLFLEGDSFADGASITPLVVPANGEQEFDLTVQTNYVSSIGRLLSRLNGANANVIEYAFAGNVVLDMTFSPKLPFSDGGKVTLARR
jgi:LEA14-like dessication related protein